MNKILFIVGPTGTGKTALALNLAEKFEGEIISADSRQVYKGMDIGTGKDIPKSFSLRRHALRNNYRPLSGDSHESGNLEIPDQVGDDKRRRAITYYTNGETKIWGLDVITPDEEFSVADYVRFVMPVIKDLWDRDVLPIVVGGTGLYLRALMQLLPEIFVPRNKGLRARLGNLSLDFLKQELKQLNSRRFMAMTQDDRNNPRRLIRAIETELYRQEKPEVSAIQSDYMGFISKIDPLIIGLKLEKEKLHKKIDTRVNTRIKQGIIQEIELLLADGYTWNLPSMSALGYREWRDYFEHKKSKMEVIQKWKINEYKYAKRQLTWFKKEPNVCWFMADSKETFKRVPFTIGEWYNTKK